MGAQAGTLMREFETVDDRRRDVVGAASLEVTGRRLWPHRLFTIETPLPPAEVVERIAAVAAPFHWWRGSRGSYPFDGTVTPETFSLQSATLPWHGWRWARPRLQGRVAAHGIGSRVSGTFSLHPAVAVVLSLWSIWASAVAALLVVSAGFDIASSITNRSMAISLYDVAVTLGAVVAAVALVGLGWAKIARPFGDKAFGVVRALATVVGEAGR